MSDDFVLTEAIDPKVSGEEEAISTTPFLDITCQGIAA